MSYEANLFDMPAIHQNELHSQILLTGRCHAIMVNWVTSHFRWNEVRWDEWYECSSCSTVTRWIP